MHLKYFFTISVNCSFIAWSKRFPVLNEDIEGHWKPNRVAEEKLQAMASKTFISATELEKMALGNFCIKPKHMEKINGIESNTSDPRKSWLIRDVECYPCQHKGDR